VGKRGGEMGEKGKGKQRGREWGKREDGKGGKGSCQPPNILAKNRPCSQNMN